MAATKITSYQSIQLFGWFAQPILTLGWGDIKQRNFTWRQLRNLGIEADHLKSIQTDKQEWLQRGGIQIDDIPDMTVFPVNPLTDFGVDLAELWQMKCSVSQLIMMQVNYNHLVSKGITPQIMSAFGLPLSAWTDLGFNENHAHVMTQEECQLVFGLGKQELKRILSDFDSKPFIEKECQQNNMPI